MTLEDRVTEPDPTDEADDEGSPGGVWVTIGLFVVFIVGVSGCFAFQVF